MPSERKRQHPGVYFVTGAGLVKIGVVNCVAGGSWTSTLKSRLGNMQSGSPVPLTLHRFIETGHPLTVERLLHRAFAEHRRHGEWFDAVVLDRIDGRTDDDIIAEVWPALAEARQQIAAEAAA